MAGGRVQELTWWILMCLLLVSCDRGEQPASCQGVTCSHHGRCIMDRVHTSCDCNPGFREGDGLTCIPDAIDLTGAEWRLVEVGPTLTSFQMGSSADEAGGFEDEVLHDVTLTHSFVLLDTEVTQGIFAEWMVYTPDGTGESVAEHPVSGVTWHEAAAFCNALSNGHGLAGCYDCSGSGSAVRCEPRASLSRPQECPGYRLPTEAEWEYAVRAGTTTATYNGDLRSDLLGCQYNPVLDPIAAFCGNAQMVRPVGTNQPNSWGMLDLLGNVAEWCHDWYAEYPEDEESIDPWGPETGTERILRGGAWDSEARDVRAARRAALSPDATSATAGFRPAKTL